jgi:hypothetical protein
MMPSKPYQNWKQQDFNEGALQMKLCDIQVGKEGDEWVVVVSHTNGKVTECHDPTLEEAMLVIMKEADEIEKEAEK